MAFDKVLLVTIAEAEKGSWTAKHWAFWSVHMSVFSHTCRMSRADSASTAYGECASLTCQHYKVGSQYEAMECFLNECRWRRLHPLSFLCPFPGRSVISHQRNHRTTNPEREVTANQLCAFLTTAFKWDICRILQWHPSSQQTFL